MPLARLPLVLLALSTLAGPALAAAARVEASTDTACRLGINGQDFGMLQPGTPRSVMSDAPEKRIECASPSSGAVAWEEHLGGDAQVDFAVAATWSRFRIEDGGWLADGDTGLRWRIAGSVDELDWAGAQAWCAAQGARLPAPDELQAFFVYRLDRTPCGEGLHCSLPHAMRLAGRFVWTSEPYGTDQALVSGLAGVRPTQQSVPQATAAGVRAICVALR